jgi:transcriptional/translational regulatory protein YebC/TACO1
MRQTVFKLLAALDDDDDVQNVFSNIDVDEATMAKLTG